jgi:hypothetical protein
MNLCEFKKDYQWFSGKTSDVARQLAFAGIAIIWIFKQEGKPLPAIPRELLWPTILLALSLAADLLQYVSATIIWGSFHRYHEKKNLVVRDIKASTKLNWPTNFLFYTKIIFVIIAYVLMIIYIFDRWRVVL